MADRDYSQLDSLGASADTDLIAAYPVGGPLKKLAWSTFISRIATAIAGTYLTIANNLSDLASASAARANLGLGTAATLASSAIFQVANNLSEVANAATARTNLGAAASASPTITGGMTFSGSTKGNVQALGALDIDFSVAEFQTKSISSNSTFTFSGATASKAQAVILTLTISSSAVPTWPVTLKWAGGEEPNLGDGEHVIGLITTDGGTSYKGFVGGVAFAVP